MNVRQLSWALIAGAVILIIISIFLLDKYTFTVGILYYFLPVWFFAGIFGLLNFTRWSLWLKILIAVIAAPLVMVALFYLMWGLSTGFRFTI